MQNTEMTDIRPYLVRALWEWINENGQTPHIIVDTDYPGVMVPNGIGKDGRVVLNISMRAAERLSMGTDLIEFAARFNGRAYNCVVPYAAVLVIYARESGRGLPLAQLAGPEPSRKPAESKSDTADQQQVAPPPPADDTPPPRPTGKPFLKVVK